MLADPEFIYRSEIEPLAVAPGTPYQISDLELASRLSFFLWSSIPDEELIQLASEGRLHDDGVLAGEEDAVEARGHGTRGRSRHGGGGTRWRMPRRCRLHPRAMSSSPMSS